MLDYVPIILFCSIIGGEPNFCDGTTAIDRHEMNPVSTPTSCLMVASAYAAAHITLFQEEHPNKKLQYRIICKHSSEKT